MTMGNRRHAAAQGAAPAGQKPDAARWPKEASRRGVSAGSVVLQEEEGGEGGVGARAPPPPPRLPALSLSPHPDVCSDTLGG